MIESVIALLSAGLKLWSDKEKTKYVDRLMALKKRYYEEYSKTEEKRSDADLDNILFDLRLLSDSFSAIVRAQNPKD